MSDEITPRLELEIGHVLFIDIVGYSKLLINEQTEALEALNAAVRSAPQFQSAEAAHSLIRLPTGDGMALVFLHSLEAPAQCAVEIATALRGHANFALRMGVHSGPVNQVSDVNGQINLTGGGVNVACRVMDIGDAGHILLSKRVAEDLEHYRQWQPHLHDLGLITVKHGVEIGIFNLYTGEAGNPALPVKIRRRGHRHFTSRRRLIVAALALTLLTAAALVWRTAHLANAGLSLLPNEKSIAVLPFESRSEDKANSYFAEGIQDEILTRLSKMRDLKVIARTSTQHYKSAPENLAEIARQLGVAHLLEGSVQKQGELVRVNVQLIQAPTASSIWAEIYDRKLTDIFAVESEVAKAIAEQLSVKLTGSEQNALSVKLTDNPDAYDAYLRGLTFEGHNGFAADSLVAKVKTYQRAVDLDPAFAQAWARLSSAHVWIYFQFERTPQRLARAKEALDQAMRLAPETGEVLLALGHYRYGTQDYEGALQAYTKARERLPNNAEILLRMGGVTRRLGHWEEALSLHTQAAELDPRNPETWKHQAWTLRGLKRYPEALIAFDRALQATPGDASLIAEKAVTYQMQGDLVSAGKTLETLPDDPAHPEIVPFRFNQWIYQRDYPPAIAALKAGLARPENFPKPAVAEAFSDLALVELLAGARESGLADARQSLAVMEEVHAQGDNNPWYVISHRAQTYSLLGDFPAALADAQRATAAYTRDAFVLPQALTVLARVQAQAGQADQAIATLERVLQMPCAYAVTPALLRLEPVWDPIRNDPRFQKLAQAQ
ncbi:MAG: tetratricopeptide repeat protein [Chthoniobacterales bacterium]